MKNALLWKLMERFGVQGIQFVLQIVLARLLDPAHYGMLSMMAIFTTLANVFIQTGFNTSLVQNKDVTEEDYSSVFWTTELIAGVLYFILFFCAPLIAKFYSMQEIVMPFRILALILFPGAFNSIQIAKISRELDFKKIFYSNVLSIIVSGIIGVLLAYCGFGLWALVAQNLINITLATLAMVFTTRWIPRFVINVTRIKVLISYGWKLLASNLLENIYADLRSLVIGKKFDSTTLGYCNRGKQFPQFVMNATNEAVKSVMLPVLSKEQDSIERVKKITRMTVSIGAYIIFPLMFGLAAVSENVIEIMLTSKWLPCVEYMKIYCFTLAFAPVSSSNLQAINAIGRSDIYLKLEIVKRTIGTVMIFIAVVFFESPIPIAMTSLIMAVVGCFINSYPNKKFLNYQYLEQLSDLLPTLIASVTMYVCTRMVYRIHVGIFWSLVLQIVVGVFSYLLISIIFHLRPYVLILNNIKDALKKKRG